MHDEGGEFLLLRLDLHQLVSLLAVVTLRLGGLPLTVLGRLGGLFARLDGASRTLTASFEAEAILMKTSAATEDGREGIQAVVERRAPRFGP